MSPVMVLGGCAALSFPPTSIAPAVPPNFLRAPFRDVSREKIEATGHEIRSARFMPNGNLLVMNADMEAAQALGAARSFLKKTIFRLSAASPHSTLDPHLFAPLFVKLCSSHAKRPVPEFRSLIGHKYERLKDFMYIYSVEALKAFSEFFFGLGRKSKRMSNRLGDGLTRCLDAPEHTKKVVRARDFDKGYHPALGLFKRLDVRRDKTKGGSKRRLSASSTPLPLHFWAPAPRARHPHPELKRCNLGPKEISALTVKASMASQILGTAPENLRAFGTGDVAKHDGICSGTAALHSVAHGKGEYGKPNIRLGRDGLFSPLCFLKRQSLFGNGTSGSPVFSDFALWQWHEVGWCTKSQWKLKLRFAGEFITVARTFQQTTVLSIRAWKLGGNGATSGHSCRGTRKTRQMGVWCGGGSRDKFQNPLTGSKTHRGAPPRAAGVVARLSGNLDVQGFGASRSGPEESEGGLGGRWRSWWEEERGTMSENESCGRPRWLPNLTWKHLLNKEMLSQEPKGEKSKNCWADEAKYLFWQIKGYTC
ncbi:hypothetical protein DFH09DRAFT_1094001 [Mycena vulgaris]|nr:hypothetical protein DFH09DRAFT_1094001 [Mycena vulgaris]